MSPEGDLYIQAPILQEILERGESKPPFLTFKSPKDFDNTKKRTTPPQLPIRSRQWLSYSKSTRAEHVDHRIRMDGIANTLNTGDGCSNQSTANYVMEIDEEGRRHFRKPTVNECERLQQWAKDHTRYGRRSNGEIYSIPNAERYSMCGNGVTAGLAARLLENMCSNEEALTIGSFCSGVGGVEMNLGHKFETRFFFDNDPYCSDVLRYHWEPILNYGDLRMASSLDLPRVDLVTMAWPCQDVSSAGLGRGWAGDRTTVVFDIIDWIAAKKPKFIFGENVKNHLSTKHEDFFLEILKRISNLGYEVDFEVISSVMSGAPQARDRLFLKGLLRSPS